MQGKRFASPGSLAAPRRSDGPGATPPHRPAASSPFASQSATRRRRKASPASFRVVSPELSVRGGGAGGYTPLASSVGGYSRGPSAGNVHSMLNELVQLSQSIATYLEQDPSTSALAAGVPPVKGAREVAALKAQEIERIVRRVQAHCQARIDALEQENASLRCELAAAPSGTADSPSVRGGIAAQGRALDELDRAWAGDEAVATTNGNNSGADLAQLRSVLLAEKRQRLLVEEQTQSLTEQHAKVVSTLERRLRKQEEQLHALIRAVESTHSGGSAARARGSASPSPGSAASGGQITPRRLLRQQIQHARQQDCGHLARADAADAEGDDATLSLGGEADGQLGDSLGLRDVQATLDAIKRSTPATAPPVGVATSSARYPTPAAAPAVRQKRDSSEWSGTGVDDIGAYLDSITKELENLGADDDLV